VTLPATLAHWLLAGSTFAAVLFFAAALTIIFERAPRPAWVLAIHYGALVLAVTQLVLVVIVPPQSDGWAAAAVTMYMVAIAVYLSAIESAKRTRLQRSFVDLPLPDRLITEGPFRWVRHPFCTGYLLSAMAPAVATAHRGLMAIALAMVAMTVSAAVREERVWLASPRGAEYRAYRRRTGMFFPFIGRGRR
jgi:protein-S-isoprenylcysteine O-methyltransferase Ste14